MSIHHLTSKEDQALILLSDLINQCALLPDGVRDIFTSRLLQLKTCISSDHGLTELRQVEEELAEKMRFTQILHDLSTRLVSENHLQILFEDILSAAIEITRANAGTVQILEEATQELHLLATRGFDRSMTEHFSTVDASSNTSCGIALSTGERTYLDFDEPGAADPDGSLRIHFEAGYRSAQSTPLVTRSGKPIGMISTHWHEHHHRPSERQLRFLDLLARQAADLIEQKRIEEELLRTNKALRISEEQFRVALMNSPILVYTHDENLRYTWIYHPAFGLNPEEIIGKTDEELNNPENVTELIALKQSVLESGVGKREEIHLAYQGETYFYDMIAEPLRDVNGRIAGMTVAAMDITEKKRLEQARLADQLQIELQRQLLNQREQERQSIAREIHDGPIQTLVSTVFDIQMTKEAINNPTLHIELSQITQSIKNAIQELRGVVNELRPPSLQKFGLSRTIQMHAQDFDERHPEIKVFHEVEDDQGKLTEDCSLTLFRIYQEGLNNIIRHAGATRAMVRFYFAENRAVLVIEDNGKGFTVQPDLARQTAEGHFGMAGMKERAEAVKGDFQVHSAPGKGTTIRVTVPISNV